MKTSLMKSELLFHHFLPTIQTKITHTKSSFFTPYRAQFLRNSPPATIDYRATKSHKQQEETTTLISYSSCNGSSEDVNKGSEREFKRSLVVAGAASIGFLVILMGHDKAWAFGPEGPMVEEFWENVRRYALYALTVSTGVVYTVFQPILELLKNPISAVLILVIIGGSIFIVSQILSAMVGVSDFSYQYAY